MRHGLACAVGAVACGILALGGCASGGGLAAPSVSERLGVLEQRLAADTNDPTGYYNYAMGLWSRREYDRADTALRQAVALDPEFALAHLAIALVQLPNDAHWKGIRRAGGDTALAEEARYREREYTHAFMIDPFLDVRALGLFRESYEDEYRDLTNVMHILRDRRGIARDSLAAPLLWLHSLAAARSNHLAEAITDVQALARVSRRRDLSSTVSAAPLVTNNYLYVLAALLQRTGHVDDATHLYIEVLTADLANYEAHVQLARIYEAAKDWGHALEQRRAAIEVYPENHCLVMDLGVTQYHAGSLADAEGSLRDARDAGPRDWRVYYWLGMVQQARSEKADARAAFESFLRLAPARDSVHIADVRRQVAALRPEAR